MLVANLFYKLDIYLCVNSFKQPKEAALMILAMMELDAKTLLCTFRLVVRKAVQTSV